MVGWSGETEGARRATGVSPDAIPPAAPLLLVNPQELPCLFLAIVNITPGCFIDPDRICIIEFTDQETTFKIRYPVNVTRFSTVIEPGCIVVREFHSDGFQSAFLGIVYCNVHNDIALLCELRLLIEALLQPVTLPAAVDDVGLMGYPVQ